MDYWLTRHRIGCRERKDGGGGGSGGGEVWNTLAEDFHRESVSRGPSPIPRVSFKSRFRRKTSGFTG